MQPMKSLTTHNILSYYKTEESYEKGAAPLGSILLGPEYVAFERINKLDFVLTTDNKRIWCRAFSQPIANAWQAEFERVGYMSIKEEGEM